MPPESDRRRVSVALDPDEAESRCIHELVDFTGKDVLEIGCGDGRLTWRYADRAVRVLTLDPKEADIERARGHARPAALAGHLPGRRHSKHRTPRGRLRHRPLLVVLVLNPRRGRRERPR